jgi:hypothetical protein
MNKEPILTLMQQEFLFASCGLPDEMVTKIREMIIPSMLEKLKEEPDPEAKTVMEEEHYTFMMFAAFLDLFFRCFGAQLDGDDKFFLNYSFELTNLATVAQKDEVIKIIADLQKDFS